VYIALSVDRQGATNTGASSTASLISVNGVPWRNF